MQHDPSMKFVRVPIAEASHKLEDVLKRKEDLSLMRQLVIRAGVVDKQDERGSQRATLTDSMYPTGS